MQSAAKHLAWESNLRKTTIELVPHARCFAALCMTAFRLTAFLPSLPNRLFAQFNCPASNNRLLTTL